MKRLFYIFSFFSACHLCSAQQSEWEIFEQMRQEMRDSFTAYRDSLEKEYAEYLRRTWEAYQIHAGISPYTEPKPDTAPVIPPQTDREYMEQEASVITERRDETIQYPEIAVGTKKSHGGTNPNPLTVPFYGSTFQLYHDVKGNTLDKINEKEISRVWSSFSSQAVNHFIADLIEIKQKRNLNDWAFYQLTEQVTREMKQFTDVNARMIFRHFILFKCGYNVRLGRANHSLVLLIAFEELVYGRQYIEKNSPRYYLFADNESAVSGMVYTIPLSIEEKGRPLNLQFAKDIQLGYTPVRLKRSWQEYTIEATINEERIRFFRHYPQTNLRIFANAPVDKAFEEEVIRQFSAYIKEKDSLSALRLLLHFTQSAFEYSYDQEQFGEEKYFFPEETFYYDASDCEDRALFFSFLVDRLLKKKVALFNYPDHVSTGVAVSQKIPGAYIRAGEKRYLVCDPTYTGADIGQCPDRYKTIKPEVITLN